MIQTNELVSFLKLKTVHSGFLDQIKVSYRPLICPFDELLNEVKDAQSAFDIGCGSGQFALLLAEFTNIKKIGGIEIDKRLITNARDLLQPYSGKVTTDFQPYDGSTLPDSMKEYDLIFLIDVLHHIPVAFQESFLKKVYDHMRPGARFIVKDINGGSPFVLFNKMHDLIFAREIGHEWSMKRLIDTAQQAGFKILSTSKKQIYVYPHYTVILTK